MADIDSRNAESSARADEHEESSQKVFADAYNNNSLKCEIHISPFGATRDKSENSISFSNPFEKKPLQTEMTEAQQQAEAEKIVHYINKRDDFGTAFQRNEIEKVIASAMTTGQLPQLIEKINTELKKQNSGLELKAMEAEEKVPYGHWGLSGRNISTMEFKHPVWIDDFDKITPIADLRLVNSNTGTAEDGIKIRGVSTERPYPSPENACGEGQPVRRDDPIHGINSRRHWRYNNGELHNVETIQLGSLKLGG